VQLTVGGRETGRVQPVNDERRTMNSIASGTVLITGPLQFTRFLATAAVTAWAAIASAPVPVASAEPCPDVEVVFARATSEPPGVGGLGQAFVDALGSRVGGKSVGVYPVKYDASSDFGGGVAFAKTVVDGIRDAGAHVASTAANCPNTRVVLGGYSQGAVVAGFVTSAGAPTGAPNEVASYLPQPLPPAVANHVAAVVLFGPPSNEFLRDVGAPPMTISPLYAAKTIQLCAPDDNICDGAPAGPPVGAHFQYAANGMLSQAADFAAGHL
jgi:cutinase